MHGALFEGEGFVRGLGQVRLDGRKVLLVGAGGAGRAIAHALSGAGVAQITVVDRDPAALAGTLEMVARVTPGIARAGVADLRDHDMLVNATPMGLKPGDVFPLDLGRLTKDVIVADIAALVRETELLALARALGCVTSDGKHTLAAQIALIAGFASGLVAGEPLVPV